jgi:lysophospholipase L1-like esterase
MIPTTHQPRRGAMRRAGEALGLVAVSALLLLALEGLARVGSRVRWGFWPATPQEERYDAAVRMGRLLMEHPFLIGVPRPGGAATVRGKSASINSHGYRGPEFDRPKPEGSFRILAIGGSTVFDVSVSGDASTWTRRLEDGLRTRFPGRRIEVVNGGVPGYTTVEMLLKLSLVDLDVVEPDLVLAYVGLNDLQPSGAPDFRADYSLGHAELQRRFLGFESRPPGLLARSVLLHKIRKRLGLDREVVPETPRRDAPRPEAESVYRERLEEIAEVARARGAAVVLMTHALRSGAGNPLSGEDFESARRWLPFLTAEGIVRGMERYNAITKEVGEELGVPVVDVARELSLDPSDFADYCHWTDSGSAKAGAFLADWLPDSLFTRASAGSGHTGIAPAGAAAFSAR